MFNTSNSGRAVVKGSADWKSRKLDLGNRHRTTLNFGDLVPAYWQHVQPNDKLRLDASILAKFMPLIAPAFTRMKIKSEWFYVPLRQIAEPTLRALQDFKPDPADMDMYFSSLVSEGFTNNVPTSSASDNQQIDTLKGFFTIPANLINAYLVGDTATVIKTAGGSPDIAIGSNFASNSWRNPGTGIDPDDIVGFYGLGQEDISSFTSKKRVSKFLSYLGLPSRLTQMRYVKDVYFGAQHESFPNVATDDGVGFSDLISSRYWSLSFGCNCWMADTKSPDSDLYYPLCAYALGGFPTSFNTSTSAITIEDVNSSLGYMDYPIPVQTTYSSAAISAIPMQAYQKIFNDFYRDEKLQPEEIRYYPSWIRSGSFQWSDSLTGNVTLAMSSPVDVYKTFPENDVTFPQRNFAAFFNNLCGLRRRNRTKDVISSCVTSQVVKGQLNVSTNETVYDAKLQSRLARYFMKKEFTGSTWAEWLSNFFGVNSNDLLNNNVIFLGGKESVVSISENIQNSESTEDSAQGNRAGLANDFHSGSEIYFRVPDFGVIMCIVSVIPDDIDNFNGLTERFQRNSPFDFNLKDFQNIGFAPVFNRRINIGFADSANLSGTLPAYPSQLGDRAHSDSNSVFGWQPYGYAHTYTPNVISGDFETSLRYWHQSPDLDFDFTAVDSDGILDYKSWVLNQLQLNYNLPSVGLRFLPYGSDLKSQYYNNVFAVTNDESGDHIVADMRFSVACHRETAFFTDAIDS